jgi:hypothetical protein
VLESACRLISTLAHKNGDKLLEEYPEVVCILLGAIRADLRREDTHTKESLESCEEWPFDAFKLRAGEALENLIYNAGVKQHVRASISATVLHEHSLLWLTIYPKLAEFLATLSDSSGAPAEALESHSMLDVHMLKLARQGMVKTDELKAELMKLLWASPADFDAIRPFYTCIPDLFQYEASADSPVGANLPRQAVLAMCFKQYAHDKDAIRLLFEFNIASYFVKFLCGWFPYKSIVAKLVTAMIEESGEMVNKPLAKLFNQYNELFKQSNAPIPYTAQNLKELLVERIKALTTQ